MSSQHSPLGGASTSALTQSFQCSALIGDLVAVVVSHESQLKPFSLHQVQPVISAVWSPVIYPGLLWVTSEKGLWRLKKPSSAGSVIDGKYVLFFFPVFVLFFPHFISQVSIIQLLDNRHQELPGQFSVRRWSPRSVVLKGEKKNPASFRIFLWPGSTVSRLHSEAEISLCAKHCWSAGST